jgi:hypothetical protein
VWLGCGGAGWRWVMAKVCDFCDGRDYVWECADCSRDACIDCRPGEGNTCADCGDAEPDEGDGAEVAP